MTGRGFLSEMTNLAIEDINHIDLDQAITDAANALLPADSMTYTNDTSMRGAPRMIWKQHFLEAGCHGLICTLYQYDEGHLGELGERLPYYMRTLSRKADQVCFFLSYLFIHF